MARVSRGSTSKPVRSGQTTPDTAHNGAAVRKRPAKAGSDQAPAAPPRRPAKDRAAKAVPPAKAAAKTAKTGVGKGQAGSSRPASGAKRPGGPASSGTKGKPAPAGRRGGKDIIAEKAAPDEAAADGEEAFLASQRTQLLAERSAYEQQAEALRAEADSLAEEMEPGDVQFDEESGEGGTTTVDRERDLALSAQALSAIEEIDHALAKIGANTYGLCERCHNPIPRQRLRALPYARLCVPCKSGGLTSRR